MWGHAERILAASSRTIVFDSPGTGRSETPLLPRSIPALAGIVTSLLDELGHQRVDVLGFSFGGTLAQQLAKDAPGRDPAARARLDVLRMGRNRRRPGRPRPRGRARAHVRTRSAPHTSSWRSPDGRAFRGFADAAPTLVVAGTTMTRAAGERGAARAPAPEQQPAPPAGGGAPLHVQPAGAGRPAAWPTSSRARLARNVRRRG